jgi:hypothetical protein
LFQGAFTKAQTVKTIWFDFNFASGVQNVNFRDEEVTIIVVSIGWLLADVLSPDTLHVTDSTRIQRRRK